jgi:hypothetical protein
MGFFPLAARGFCDFQRVFTAAVGRLAVNFPAGAKISLKTFPPLPGRSGCLQALIDATNWNTGLVGVSAMHRATEYQNVCTIKTFFPSIHRPNLYYYYSVHKKNVLD